MGKAFIGPFKAVAVDKVTVQADGAIYLTLRDRNGSVLGLITDRTTVSLMIDEIAAADVPASARQLAPYFNTPY